MSVFTGPILKPQGNQQAKRLVILLHGWGSDGENLMDIAEFFSESMPDTEFLCPNGWQPCPEVPGGYQWFPIPHRDEDALAGIYTEGSKTVIPLLKDFIEQETKKRHLSKENVALIGFSQGAMMALCMGLIYPLCHAIISYSGRFIESVVPPPLQKTPTLLIHGQDDEVVTFDSFIRAKEILTENDIPLEFKDFPRLGHSINIEGMVLGRDFLIKNVHN